MNDEKLQKVLARAGLGSRREMERWIEQGRVQVNGQRAGLGDRVTEQDRIDVDGHPLKRDEGGQKYSRVLVYNKPIGEVCTRNDPEGRPTVFDHLPKVKEGRWIVIGRLDINTSGLLLFTTDGELANRLMHPSSNIDREYAVRVMGEVTEEKIAQLKAGVLLEDGMARFADVRYFDGEGINQWYHVVLMEGRNREVRRLWESQGLQVSRLKRVRYGCIFMPSTVPMGKWAELKQKDLNDLCALVGLEGLKVPPTSVKEKEEVRRQQQKRARVQERTKPAGKASGKPGGKAGGKASGRTSGKPSTRLGSKASQRQR